VRFNDDDTPAMAVVQAAGGGPTDYQTAPALWAFTVTGLPAPYGGQISVGSRTVQGENGGALFIFDWAQFELDRAKTLFGGVPQASLAWLWRPGIDMDCGDCFRNRSSGGTDVGTAALHFDTSIALSGSLSSPSHWSVSAINHEFGHFIMDQYSRSPNEGGMHSVDQVSSPGLAWSEGWATLSGQTAISSAAGSPQPVYFDVQKGGSFWIDISKGLLLNMSLPSPNLYGALDQRLNEFVVTGMVWDLWTAVGDSPIFAALASRRLKGPYNRGYSTVDLVDYADALACGGGVSAYALNWILRTVHEFPWDGRPLCP